jgi:3-hydroxybutyryl-CoA dehydrogenase
MTGSPYRLDTHTPVAVIGAGSMGGGIAQIAAQAGHAVRLYDAQEGAAAKALERIAADLAGAVQRGRMSEDQRGEVLARIAIANGIDDLDGAGLVVEAIIEKLEPKQALWRQLEEVLDETCVFATNTSSISITAVAQGLVHPQRLIGWHFFNPAPRMKLVEIIRGLETDAALVPALQALAQAWGKTPVVAPNAPGFIVNRVARPYYAEGLRLLAERIAPLEAIDRLLREAGGFALGPFELMDLIGVEVNLSVTESVFAATQFDNRYAPNLIQQELVRAGHFGRKSGRGFYDYRPTAVKPQALGLAPVGPVPAVSVAADLGLLAPLVERLRGAGLRTNVDDALPAETLRLGDVTVTLTDGRTATERAASDGPLLLLDLARDFATTTLVGAAASAGAEGALPMLAALLQPAGVEVLRLNDVAGLALMRVVCGLANEAADVMTWSGTRAQDIDVAMVLGTAYPLGPLAWADAIGASRVVTVLQHLQAHYGETRYRRSPRLARAHFGRERLHA